MDVTGIIAIIVVIGGPMAIAITAIVSEQRSKQRKYEAMVKAVELGRTPEEVKRMFEEEKEKNGKDANSRLRQGIILIAIALGVAAMALILNKSMVFGGSFGNFYLGASAFLLILGLAFLLIWRIHKPKAK
jgi:multisubunit Na+/H+ antiporter MnhC subunit